MFVFCFFSLQLSKILAGIAGRSREAFVMLFVRALDPN